MTDLVDRSAFIYLEPKQTEKNMFAQCETCRLFVPGKSREDGQGRCVIHGSYVDVDEDDSCNFYVPWPTVDGASVPEIVKGHAAELKKGVQGSVTTTESGFTDRLVQCRRCKFAKTNSTICGLFQALNLRAPAMVTLDPNIKPNGCCNAQIPVERDRPSPASRAVGLGRKSYG